MYENAVPVYEMKNKLSYYLHKAESEGPVYISNRGKPAFILQTIEDYEEKLKMAPKEKTPFEVAEEMRKKFGITEDDFEDDITDYFDSLRDHNYMGPEKSENIFEGV